MIRLKDSAKGFCRPVCKRKVKPFKQLSALKIGSVQRVPFLETQRDEAMR